MDLTGYTIFLFLRFCSCYRYVINWARLDPDSRGNLHFGHVPLEIYTQSNGFEMVLLLFHSV